LIVTGLGDNLAVSMTPLTVIKYILGVLIVLLAGAEAIKKFRSRTLSCSARDESHSPNGEL
jgi:hypothetical protein